LREPTISRIKNFLKSQVEVDKKNFYLSTLFGVLSGFLVIYQAWILASILNSVIFKNASLDEIKNELLILIVVFIFKAILTLLSNTFAHKFASNIKIKLRDNLLRHLQKVGPIYPNKKHSGSDVNTLIDAVESIEKYYTLYMPSVVFVAVIPIAILIVAFPIDWISSLILLVTAPVIVFFMILIGKGAQKLNQKQWRQLSRLSSHFIDALQGLPTLKIFNGAKKEALIIKRLANEYKDRTMSVLKVAFLSSLLLEFFSSVGIAMVAVTIGFRLMYGQMEFIDGMFLLLIAPEFYMYIRNMGSSYHARMEGIGAAEQILELVEKKSLNNFDSTNKTKLEIGDTLEIEFRDVKFSYDKNQEALKGINLKIKPNQMTVFIGKSGSGKSTIANLLLGFITPTSGKILINGKSLSEFSLEEWRQKVAWMPQFAHLFKGTIKENIKLAKQDASEEELKEASKFANCDEFISRLPNGYDTLIGEKGSGLSGGQRQRVALARAFLKEVPLLVLDEPTASLDKKSEEFIEAGIEKLKQSRTIVAIAHRLHTIKMAEQVVIINDGKILDSGSHSELMKSNEFYKELIKRYYEKFTI